MPLSSRSYCLAFLLAIVARSACVGWANEPPGAVREICRISVVNEARGEVSVSEDAGATWQRIGSVLRPAEQVNREAYTAAKWAKTGTVAATAVNAIHIKTDQNQAEDRGVVFSILPKEFYEPPPDYQSFLSPSSSIITDIRAGEQIFGGRYSPIVGNRVLLQSADTLAAIPVGFVPKVGDRLIIIVEQPAAYPCQIVFENRFGGLITMIYCDGSSEIIGQVLKPVLGVGRFTGTQFAGIGRIRANHTGVIDVSLSPLGSVGGFQIIPAAHAMSPEMGSARTLTQWMVVGPPCVTDPSWEGLAPLFFGYLRPVYDARDLYAEDWESRLLARFLVEVRRKGSDWGPAPAFELDPQKPLPDEAFTALEDIEAFRILFPVESSP